MLRKDPRFAVFPERAKIVVDGKQVEQAEFAVFLLHKPRGVITTRSDEKGRPTVFSLIPKIQDDFQLHAVGRLDQATTGLLLLTNDTQLSNWLTAPENDVPRVYVVTVRGEITETKLAQLRGGVRSEGELLAPDSVELKKSSGKESHLVVTLSEGKNREIRRLFLELGNEVTRLKRISYGKLELGELEPGQHRRVEIQELRSAFPSAPLRIK